MPRADRLLRLLGALRTARPPVTAATLAGLTGVSLRTLYRDIAGLRAAGALIDGEAGLGYRLTEDPALPPQMFTRIEVEALVLGLAEVRQVGDPELAAAAASAEAKIVATLPERVQRQAIHVAQSVHRLQRRAPAPACLPVLRAAAWDEQAVDMTYIDGAGARTRRRIWPLSIAFLDQSLMCLAWCCLRRDFRRFYLTRIEDVAPAQDWFRPRRVALLRAYIAQLSGGSASAGDA